MFPEGGNYCDKEALNTINALNALSNMMIEAQAEITDDNMYKQNNCKPIIKIKESLSKLLKPYVNLNFNSVIIIW